ncbi:MAG: 2-phospho-L-lactate transferase [Boseongicola sp.]|nr:MAG: 2-phospho-L-lactate transferase [Boseongicola sp.]
MSGQVIMLSGGVGGAKLVLGMSHVVEGNNLLVVCNTADDFDHLGLRICPDIDSVLYALAGLSDQVRGWGRRNETWTFMSALKSLEGPDWFNLGDGDLATHVVRTELLRQGKTLGEVTATLARRMGIQATIVPMCDQPVSTSVLTQDGRLNFQHYFVREQCNPIVTGFEFENIQAARPQSDLVTTARDPLDAIVIAPSNPYVSVDPILQIPGLREALQNARAPIVAVSPIIGGQAIKGPAAKMMMELGKDVSVLGIARHYSGLIDGLLIDEADETLATEIEDLGITVRIAKTLMTDVESKAGLAEETLSFARGLAA